MNDRGQKLQIIRNYLGEQFAGSQVEPVEMPASDIPAFAIEKDGRHYQLQIDADVLDRYSAEQLPARLDEWKLTEELCRAEGLPVVLTERGVRLASSN
ncbi:MAG TPA: hypothetical protein VFL57_02855 [Bryobacteraceae bacterium]|nr:hypothetical protein [Bryobacteraceae bacterium]